MNLVLSPPPFSIKYPDPVVLWFWSFIGYLASCEFPSKIFVECKNHEAQVNSPVQKHLLNANHMGTVLGLPSQKKIVKCKSYGVPYWLQCLTMSPPANSHPPKPLNVNHEFWHLMFVRPDRPGYITLHSCGIYNSDIGVEYITQILDRASAYTRRGALLLLKKKLLKKKKSCCMYPPPPPALCMWPGQKKCKLQRTPLFIHEYLVFYFNTRFYSNWNPIFIYLKELV